MFNCIVFCADDMTRCFLKLHSVWYVKSIGGSRICNSPCAVSVVADPCC